MRKKQKAGWDYPKFWWLRKLMFWILMRRKVKDIRPGQMYWPWDGHADNCNHRSLYIVAGKDHEGYWYCLGMDYFGHDFKLLGGNAEHRCTEKELRHWAYLGMVPTWKMFLTIGPYRDFLKDRAWEEVTKKGDG